MNNEYEIDIYDDVDTGRNEFWGKVTKKNTILFSTAVMSNAFDAYAAADEVVKKMIANGERSYAKANIEIL
jgi:hypothetical protein